MEKLPVTRRPEGIGDRGDAEAVAGGEGRAGSAKGREKPYPPRRPRPRELRCARTDLNLKGSAKARSAIRHGRRRMNPNNSDQAGEDITGYGKGLPMQGFYAVWNPGLQPSGQQYPYFPGPWTAALNQGLMPLPNPPSTPAAPAQNQPVDAMLESVKPAVIKESQGDGEGASLRAGRRHKVVPSRRKLSNFSPKEDEFLVKSWLEISCEPIINTGQKKEGFWARIKSRYNSKRGSYPERSIRSLQSRWDTIKAEANKFAGYMENVLQDNPSGMSDADKTSLALANFAGTEEHAFTYMHCWNLLKDQPKWMELSLRGTQHGEDDGIADHIPTASNNIDDDAIADHIPTASNNIDDDAIADHIPTATNNIDDDLETPSSQYSGSKRPMGRDATKKAAKKSLSSSPSDSSQYVSKLQDLSAQKLSVWQEENERKSSRYEQMVAIDSQRYDELRQHNQRMAAIEEEKLRLMRKKVDILQTHEEERILGIDLDKCIPRLRLYYEKKQQRILQDIGANVDP